MSTQYSLKENVKFAEVFDGRLERFGVYEFSIGLAEPNTRCLTDGSNILCVCEDELVGIMTGYGQFDSKEKILTAISVVFDTNIFSEHQPQFWGFDTDEEWEESLNVDNEKLTADLYIEVMKYVRGEPHNIDPTTDGIELANIAKRLIAEKPDLASPDREAELMEETIKIHIEHYIARKSMTVEDLKAVIHHEHVRH